MRVCGYSPHTSIKGSGVIITIANTLIDKKVVLFETIGV
jgi:hypothetical protein